LCRPLKYTRKGIASPSLFAALETHERERAEVGAGSAYRPTARDGLDGYQWQGDERQKNAETIPSKISVQDTGRRTDSNVASREREGMTHDRASVPAASRQARKFDVSARTRRSNKAWEDEERAA
jgi:hypothetical protein